MLEIKVFGTTPPCAKCIRAEKQAQKAADQFPDRVKVVKMDALDPKASDYGIIVTPMVVVGEKPVGVGKVVPATKLVNIIKNELGG